MSNKPLAQIAILLVTLAIAVAGTLHFARRDLRRCAVDDTLQPIAALLDDNRRIIESLRTGGFAESESAILSTYLQRIRKDGVPDNSAMKQDIDALNNNNTAIVTLLSKYSTHARLPAFKVAADQFRVYASSFRDRWQSTFEIFMAGGSLPAAGPAYPAQLAAALDQELSAD